MQKKLKDLAKGNEASNHKKFFFAKVTQVSSG